MCGVVGIVSNNPVNQDIYDALTIMQHRGQSAAGIMTCEGNRIFLHKGTGLVRDAIRGADMIQLRGPMGIGQVRYPTAGADEGAAEAQPLYVNSPYGLGIAHNGNLINARELKKHLLTQDLRHLNTASDSEVLLNVFAHELQKLGKLELKPEHLFQAVRSVHKRCKGAYAVVILIAGHGILGFRDPYAIRPLIYGKRESIKQTDYMIASESVALDSLDYKVERDIAPGEAIFIDVKGNIFHEQCADNPQYSPCIFEYVYLARPDSLIDKILVYKVRLKMGESLAEKILREQPDLEVDVVMPIPDTSRTAAFRLAYRLGVKYREGFVKNRYIGRTFIMPGQKVREKSVKQKLNPIRLEFQGKNVLLVDDSIVRGTTSKEIIRMARQAGAKKVYFASASPAVSYPNVYGIDMPAAKELVAHERSVEEIAKTIGADWLVYNDLPALYKAAWEGNPTIKRFEDSVFTGDYVTKDVDNEYLAYLEKKRSDKVRSALRTVSKDSATIDMYSTD